MFRFRVKIAICWNGELRRLLGHTALFNECVAEKVRLWGSLSDVFDSERNHHVQTPMLIQTQPRFTVNTFFCLHFSKNTCLHTFLCSFQVKWTVEAMKHQPLLFLFTQIMIKEADYQGIKVCFCAIPCIILHYDLRLRLCKICKLIHFNDFITKSDSYVLVFWQRLLGN